MPSHSRCRPSGLGPSRRDVGRRGPLRAVAVDGSFVQVGSGSHLAPRPLVPEWLHPTRLETRTKECNMRASLWVANPSAQ